MMVRYPMLLGGDGHSRGGIHAAIADLHAGAVEPKPAE
jgi:hypothetical protein